MDRVDALEANQRDLPKTKEVDDNKTSDLLVFVGKDSPGFIEDLKKQELTDKKIISRDLPYFSQKALSLRIEFANSYNVEEDNLLINEDGKIPNKVVVHATKEGLRHGCDYQCLWIDWFRLPQGDRPQVVLYTDKFDISLSDKHQFQGFLFCDSFSEMKKIFTLTDQLLENRKIEIYKPENLVVDQKDAYDNSDLREWENKTADTYQSLKFILQRFKTRNEDYSQVKKKRYTKLFAKDENTGKINWYDGGETEATPKKPIKTILDLGTGEGRIAGMLARCGYNVMGLDISQEQLDRSRTRVIEEGQGLRGEINNSKLSYNALDKLKKEGLVSSIDLSDRETLNRYLPVQGNFFELDFVLNQALIDWSTRYPEIDPYDFFGTDRYNEYAFSDEWNMFAYVGFDAVMFNWHTFCEIGSPGNEKNVLEQVLNVMWPGGELMIEIPDRMGEPYASSLKEYYSEHPDEPYGTIRDPKPEDFKGLDGKELYPPRYFPDINELVLLLKSIGYEIDLEEDVKSYIIADKENKETNAFREYFVTARKSKA